MQFTLEKMLAHTSDSLWRYLILPPRQSFPEKKSPSLSIRYIQNLTHIATELRLASLIKECISKKLLPINLSLFTCEGLDVCGCLMHSCPSAVAILAAWPASSLEQCGKLSSDPPEDRPRSDCSSSMSGYLPSLQKEPKKSSRSMAQTMAPPKLFSLRKSTCGQREHLATKIKWHLHNKLEYRATRWY